MAPKRSKVRLTGKGAAKATATRVVKADGVVAAAPAPTSATLPADPQDRRLTLAGAVLDGEGKIDILAYEDLMPAFEHEPPPNVHPDPERPGVRANEHFPKGLRLWDDIRQGHTKKDGAGWIAVRSASEHEKKKEKWFNIRICGSWRMAFLLAKLQLACWDERAAWLRSPANATVASADPTTSAVAASTASASATPPQATEVDAQSATPKRRRRRAQPEEPGVQSARKAPRKTATTGDGAQEQKQPLSPKPAEKTPLITSTMLVSSVRLQQVMELQREKLELQQKQQQQQPQQPQQQ
jgi:hypothetical protein